MRGFMHHPESWGKAAPDMHRGTKKQGQLTFAVLLSRPRVPCGI